ncbi:hypothetical protein GCM10028857_07890 [Salinarchaeum chitinilyticum]
MSLVEKSGLFREPEPRSLGLIFLAGAFLQFAIYGYYSIVHDFTGGPLIPALGSMFLAFALPEFLPTENQSVVGAARITAFGYGAIMVAYALFWI